MYKWARLRTVSRNRTFYRILLVLFTIPICRAVLVNRTIDSNFGDPVTGFVPIYQPQHVWVDQTCPDTDTACYLQVRPDTAKAFDGTWMVNQITFGNINLTLRFTGVAVWVFVILPDFMADIVPLRVVTYANITLDGQYAGNFYHYPVNSTDLIYNATIFSASGLANTPHELVIGENQMSGSRPGFQVTFDWAIYTVDLEAPASQNTPSSTSVVFPSTTSSSSTGSTASTTPSPSPQSSSSKIGVIVGSTLGGLAVITLVLVFLVRRLRRAPQVRLGNGNAEGILNIDVSLGPRHQPYYKREIPVPDQPTQIKAGRLREARQRELDERIRSARHELDNLRSLRNARSADDIGDPSAAGPSRPTSSSPELALLRNEMQQLRDQMDYLQAQRESDWAQGLSNEPLPPAYT
ncbi:hypothetical protein M378DRAFT_167454 [Amanita muscaria Koide BX008]|uniref:Uncharacterized protein n=1 Tax=Amanita muscaria (strain Koide BX008) TaxID=946122 RepID=A0A0C2WXI5_AMAMK|nr:hypothetical protein M378DRAFT_167454 [Amanita muscaria Koide BX008]